jgi:endonuclease YncB( thermonuclease family)
VVGQGARKVVQLRDWQRTRRRRRAVLLIGLILIGLIGAPVFTGFLNRRPVNPSAERPDAQGAGVYEVIDGDTIRAPYGVKYRLLGFDAPETFQAKCDVELELGKRATERLKETSAVWRGAGHPEGKLDHHGRTLAHLTVKAATSVGWLSNSEP